MRLETKRLILREINEEDEKDLIENINNLNVSRYLVLVPYPYKKKDAKWWINKCKKNAKEKPRTNYNFNIELKLKRGIIGAVGLGKVDKFQGTATLGYWLGEKYWKQKIMSEATKEVLDFAFNRLKLRRINVSAYIKNKPSNNLIKKMGFKHEGMKRKAVKVKSTGKICDENIYGLLKEGWKKHRRKLK